MRIEGTNKDGEAIAQEIAGITEKDEKVIKNLIGQINKHPMCRNQGCQNFRSLGSSRCKECSEKYRHEHA